RRHRRRYDQGGHDGQRREKAPETDEVAASSAGFARVSSGEASEGVVETPSDITLQMGPYRGGGEGLALAQTMMIITPSPYRGPPMTAGLPRAARISVT